MVKTYTFAHILANYFDSKRAMASFCM